MRIIVNRPAVLCVLLLLFLAPVSYCEDDVVFSHERRFGLSMGWRSTWVLLISYQQSLGLPWASQWVSELTIPVFAEGFIKNGSLMTGVILPTRESTTTGFGFMAKVMTGMLWSSDDLGSRWSLGFEGLLSAGWYENSWSFATEIGYRAAMLTLFRHSDIQRISFTNRFPGDTIQGPTYALIAFSSQKAGFGFAGSLLLDKGVSITVHGGTEQIASRVPGQGTPPIFPLPIYFQTGVVTLW